MENIISTAVLGSTGYVGLELVYLLSKHPNVKINFLGSESFKGKDIRNFDKRITNSILPKLESSDNIDISKIDLVFLALPHGISQKFVKENIDKSFIIDLSGDFRLNNENVFRDNYKIKHTCPDLLKNFTYGLAEIYFEKIKKSKNISVPGCYPTSILLPLIPLIKEQLIESDNIIIDSKSGYSGAGKKFDLDKLIQDKNLNFYNYNTNKHRHICEIDQELKKHSNDIIKFSFNPHILPIFRGLMSTIYCDLKEGVKKENLIQVFKNEYKNNSFINILDNNSNADFFSVINTNRCLIKLFDHFSSNKIIIVTLIDNLIKGASGQAVQCMNIVFGLDENVGLV